MAAEAELSDAVLWYESQRQGLGQELLLDFKTTLQRIVAFPKAWPRASKRSRRALLQRFPYGIIYQIREKEILVLAVMHLRRKPRYWAERE
jgi:plasmid stabilization system protein ParE